MATCKCGKRHRKLTTVARCIWPRAEWIDGEGAYALLAHCRVLTISLHADEQAAVVSKRQIDRTGCGGRCSGDHEIVQIALPEETS